MNFNTQICTTREQSERLLALGLKKETADCRWVGLVKDARGADIPERKQVWSVRASESEGAMSCSFMRYSFIPAWSLHRLMIMMPVFVKGKEGYLVCTYSRYSMFVANHITKENLVFDGFDDLFDNIISSIDWMIDNQYFPTEYLRSREKLYSCRSTGKTLESLICKQEKE